MLGLLVSWVLVAKEKKCSGNRGVEKPRQESAGDCAKACRKEASMFRFSLNKFGSLLCDGQGCRCFCEKSALSTGECVMIQDTSYALYKYTVKGKYAYI